MPATPEARLLLRAALGQSRNLGEFLDILEFSPAAEELQKAVLRARLEQESGGRAVVDDAAVQHAFEQEQLEESQRYLHRQQEHHRRRRHSHKDPTTRAQGAAAPAQAMSIPSSDSEEAADQESSDREAEVWEETPLGLADLIRRYCLP